MEQKQMPIYIYIAMKGTLGIRIEYRFHEKKKTKFNQPTDALKTSKLINILRMRIEL